MKKQFVKIAAAALLVVASVLSLASCATVDGMKEDVDNFIEDSLLGEEETLSVVLCAAEGVVVPETEESPAYVEKIISATVYPESATNKALEWEVFWVENTLGEEALVEDYIKIETSGDYNNVCAVRCYQQFADSVIGIKAKTVKGECEAVCEVTFVGEAQNLVITGLEDAALVYGEEINFSVISENLFGTSLEGLSQLGDVTCKLTVSGSIVVKLVTIEGEESENVFTFDDDMSYQEKEAVYRVLQYTHFTFDSETLTGYMKVTNMPVGDVLDDDTYYTFSYVSGFESLVFTLTVTDTTYGTTISVPMTFAEVPEIELDSNLEF